MKNNLGRFLLLLHLVFFSFVYVKAEDFDYIIKVDKNTSYVKEAVLLTFDINQTNHDIVLLFDFNLLKNENFTFQQVDIQQNSDSHALQLRYTYLIYPLNSGEILIDFKLRKRVTTDDSVAYSFSGDRDNVKGLVTKDSSIDLKPLTLHVKPLPKGIQLVGDFTLEHSIKKHQVKAYETLPFTLILKGKGYPPLLKHILPTDVNFTRFTEKPIVHTLSTKEGSQSTIRYNMALSHTQSFTLPSIELKAFNPQTEKTYTLSTPSQAFTIIDVNKTTLTDKTNSPPLLKEDWHWLKMFLSYLVVFISGFFTAKVLQFQIKGKHNKALHPLIEKIKTVKTEKELLQILMAYDSQHFITPITKLENSLYANGKINLAQVKKEALDLL